MWIDVIGWLGALLVLAAYGLISFKRVEGNSLIYQLLNIFGSICLVLNTYYYGAIPSTLVNIIWALIAVVAIFAIIKGSRRKGIEKEDVIRG